MFGSAPNRLRPMDLGELIDETFTLYRQNFALFAGVVAILAIPQAILNIIVNSAGASTGILGFSSSPGLAGLSYFISFVFSALITGALAQAISARYLGRRIDIWTAYASIGLGTFVMLALASILQALCIGFALICLIIPGIFVGVHLAFVSQAVVLERLNVFEAFGRSWGLVTGSWWRTFGILVVLFLIVGILQSIFGGIAGALFASGHVAIGTAVSAVIGILVKPISLGGATLLYYDLRVRKEGFDIEQMARSADTSAPTW